MDNVREMYGGKNVWSLIILLMVALIAGGIGFGIGKMNRPLTNDTVQQFGTKNPEQVQAPKSFIQQQQTLVTGRVTQVTGDQITVSGDDGQSVSLKLSRNLAIYKESSTTSAKPAKASTDKKDIQLNQQARFNLSLENGLQTVTSITYP